MSRFRFRPALLITLLLAACLTPTDGSGRFGEARVQPEFSEGNSPNDLGIQVDSIRTIIRRDAATTIVNAVMAYEPDAVQAWIIELVSAADDVDVTIELLVGSNVAYSGNRDMTVTEGSAGRAPVAPVPVSYIASEIAASVEVAPDQAALGALADMRQLEAIVRDPNGVVLAGKMVEWSSVNDDVATVNATGLVTATGQGVTNITASVDGVSDAATIIVDTMIVRASTITADSASIAANGLSTTQITVRIMDGNGMPINASAGTVTLATTLGSLGDVTDHEDGTYTATLTAGTLADAAIVTGLLNGGAMSDSAVVEFRALGTDPGTTTINADSAALNADGAATTLVTVTVRDANGNPVGTGGGVVLLHSTLGGLTDVVDHGDGTYTATLTAGTVAGVALISGSLNGTAISDTASITLRPLPAHAQTTDITADSAALDADGESTTLVTVRVLDEHGNPVGAGAGEVLLAASMGALTLPVVDHGNGTYTTTLTAGTTAGIAMITGTLNGAMIGDTAFVELRPLDADPTTTIITADSTALDADGESTTLITVRVLDQYGNPVGESAGEVRLATTLGTLTDPSVDHGNGTYTATLTAGTTAGTAVITGTLNGVAISDNAEVTLRPLPPHAQTTTIMADSASIAADGVASTLVTVRVLDEHGNAVGASAGEVALTTSLGGLTDPVNHQDGTYTANLTAGTTAGTAVITGTLNGDVIGDSAFVDFRPLDPDPTTTTITADSASITANGLSSTQVTVRVLDEHGNPIGASAGEVALTTSLGDLTDPVDHQDGTYTATLTAGTTTGNAIITGTLNGEAIADNATVILRPLPPHAQTTTIAADSTALAADGVSSTLVTVRVLDEHGNPVGATAGEVRLASNLGSLTFPVIDHGDGTYTATLTAGTTSGTARITGTLNGEVIGDTAFVDFRPLEPDPTTTTITADSASIAANGESATLVTVRVLDEHGNLVGESAGEVRLASTLGALTDPPVDHGDGTYSATLTAGTTAGTAVISGTLNGVAISDNAVVTLRPLPPHAQTTTITADSASIAADGVSSTLVTVRVLDEHNNPVGVSAGDVALATTLGSLTQRVDHGDGTYSATLAAGTTSGTARITGTLNGEVIGDTAFVAFRPLEPDPTTTTITADSTSMAADGESSTLVTVRVLDQHGNPIGASAGTVELRSSLGDLTDPVNRQDGTYTATLTAGTTSGIAIISGTLNGEVIGDSALVELRPLAPDPTTTTLTADSTSIVADGVSFTTVTVRVLDRHGNPVGRSAGVVRLATSLGILSDVIDHRDGTYTARLRADVATPSTSVQASVLIHPDTAIVTGTLNGQAIADTARVEFWPAGVPRVTSLLMPDSGDEAIWGAAQRSDVRNRIKRQPAETVVLPERAMTCAQALLTLTRGCGA